MSPRWRFTGSIIISALILMWYAFYNRYPLVTGDTGAYIKFAFDFRAAQDRSTFYSLFAAIGGLSTLSFAGVRGSLWLPVFFQCVIVAWLLFRCYRMLAGNRPHAIGWLAIVIAIAAFTGVSFTAAYMMPDIFTGILLLAFILYISDKDANKATRNIYLGIIAFATLVHNSHFLILPLAAGTLYLVYRLRGIYNIRKQLFKVLMVCAGCWMLMCCFNFINGFGFTLSPKSHVFLVGKMAEAGVLQQYLDENCDTKPNKLCAYKNELPTVAYHYMWTDDGPFGKIGGWDSSAPVHNQVLHDIFTTPRYLGLFAKQSVLHTGTQLSLIDIPVSENSFEVESSPFNHINIFIKSEIPQFRHSRQQNGIINNTIWIIVQRVVLILSSLWVLFLLIRNLPSREKILRLYFLVLTFILCNAFVTASFANILPRLETRVFWVLPAMNIIVLIQYYFARRMR